MLKDVLHPSISRTHSPGVRTGGVLVGVTLVVVALSLLARLATPAAVVDRPTKDRHTGTSGNSSGVLAPLAVDSWVQSVSNLTLSPDGLLVADVSAKTVSAGKPATNRSCCSARK